MYPLIERDIFNIYNTIKIWSAPAYTFAGKFVRECIMVFTLLFLSTLLMQSQLDERWE